MYMANGVKVIHHLGHGWCSNARQFLGQDKKVEMARKGKGETMKSTVFILR